MRYMTIDTQEQFERLVETVTTIVTGNVDLLGPKPVSIPHSQSSAWQEHEEDVLLPLHHISIFYQKVSNPCEKDLRPRQVIPIRMSASKSGSILMSAYDMSAGFIKNFRLDAIRKLLIRNHRARNDEWAVKDITFRGRLFFTSNDYASGIDLFFNQFDSEEEQMTKNKERLLHRTAPHNE
mgnify:FL=1|jgi:hypothetical protein